MLNTKYLLIIAISLSSIALNGCVSSQQSLANIQRTEPSTFILPVNYVDAYANSSYYFQNCVPKRGSSYPIRTTVNGSTITTTGRTADTTVSQKLDRANKKAELVVFSGSRAIQFISFNEINKNSTNVSLFRKKILLRSDNDEKNAETVDLIKMVSTKKIFSCIKK